MLNGLESLPAQARQMLDDASSPEEHAVLLHRLTGVAAVVVDGLVAGLGDPDERVRAQAASGLAELGHSQALSACLATLDDNADPLHADMTPAVYALGNLGWVAVPPLLDLMLAERTLTRLHAERALELIVNGSLGFVPGQGFPSAEAEEQVRAIWRDNGDYRHDADEQSRAAAVCRWHDWLRQQGDS